MSRHEIMSRHKTTVCRRTAQWRMQAWADPFQGGSRVIQVEAHESSRDQDPNKHATRLHTYSLAAGSKGMAGFVDD